MSDDIVTHLDINAARRRLLGRDAILRAGRYFGKTGRISDVIPDPKHGYLILVKIYKKGAPGVFSEFMTNDARTYWPPENVEMVP